MATKRKSVLSKTKSKVAAALRMKVKGARVSPSYVRRRPQVGCFCKRGDWRCQGKLRKVLYIGEKKTPETLIIVFHGVGDDANGNVQWSEVWAEKFPKSLVIIPQSPCVNFCYKPEDKAKGPLGYDWLPQPGLQDISDKEANVRALQMVTEKRLQQLDGWLSRVLRKFGLRNENVVLAGFSQGCVLATILGIRRNVKAVAVAGGIGTEPVYSASMDKYFGRECWARWEEMVPLARKDVEGSAAPRTKFLVCCGGADCTVPRKKIGAMLTDFKVNWKVVDGMEHEFPNYWRGQLVAWMKKAVSC